MASHCEVRSWTELDGVGAQSKRMQSLGHWVSNHFWYAMALSIICDYGLFVCVCVDYQVLARNTSE